MNKVHEFLYFNSKDLANMSVWEEIKVFGQNIYPWNIAHPATFPKELSQPAILQTPKAFI